jgi:Zn-finger nucleic acid-binding protein
MICLNCGAPTELNRYRGVFACNYCRSQFIAPPDPDGVQVLEPSSLSCPGCGEQLFEGVMEGHALHYCVACGGMLIPLGHFMSLVGALRALRVGQPVPVTVWAAAANEAETPRNCPQCATAMTNHRYGGGGHVMIDTCSPCNVNWLDKRELQRIVAAPDYTYTNQQYSY